MFAFWREEDFNFLYVNSGKSSLHGGSLNLADNGTYCQRTVKTCEGHACYLQIWKTILVGFQLLSHSCSFLTVSGLFLSFSEFHSCPVLVEKVQRLL